MIAAASIELILNLLTAKASNWADRSSFASTLGTWTSAARSRPSSAPRCVLVWPLTRPGAS